MFVARITNTLTHLSSTENIVYCVFQCIKEYYVFNEMRLWPKAGTQQLFKQGNGVSVTTAKAAGFTY